MTKYQVCFSCFLIMMVLGNIVSGQQLGNISFTGLVTNPSGEPLAAVTLKLVKSGQKTTTDKTGHFSFTIINLIKDELKISHLGYKDQIVKIRFEKNLDLNIVLEEGRGLLKEVNVTGKSVNRNITEQPIITQLINTKAAEEQPNTLVELLNRSAGIRIRQTGGLGSSSNLSINGFQNRSIRYFKDGIPMDYLGGGFDISLVPVNMLDHVEVYKGVLPVSLGADALGGALNMVTKKTFQQYADFSYETGSFNTHRLSLNAFHKNEKKHYFLGLDAFYNYSDNDYKVDVVVTNEETEAPSDVRVPLFHNQFKNYYAEVYGGVIATSWADELRFGLTAFKLDRQINYGASMTQAIGSAVNSQDAIIPTLRYKKSLLDQKLNIDQFFVANRLHSKQRDTAGGQYNWLGQFRPSADRTGELIFNGSLARLNYDYYTSRTNLAYDLNPQQRLEFNLVFSGFSRTGNDPFGRTFVNGGMDILSAEASYNKTIAALGLSSQFFNAKLSNQFIVKHYRYHTDATDADYQGNPVTNKNQSSSWGIAEAVKFTLSERSFFRFSAETALRLPEQDELFGDGDRKLSNFTLKPERSLNVNLGYHLDTKKGNHFEFNTFYRVTRNLILSLPYNFLFTQSQNIDNVSGIGFEADGAVSLLSWLKANANFTYQDQRIFDTGVPSTEKARLRNTPYFFANAALNGTFSNLLHRGDKLQASWYYLFVREYYLEAIPKDKEPGGFLGLWGKAKIDAPNVIPNQSIHSLGLVYHPAKYQVSLGLQLKNIFNVAVYDNFRIQNAGRSIFIKLNYQIRSKSTALNQ